MRIITAGPTYTDIDAYGGCIAYAELLNLRGQTTKAVAAGPINASVSPLVLAWNAQIDRNYTPTADDRFTFIDVSEPEFLHAMHNDSNVDEVIDHHPGFEAYWQERIGDNTDIEFVGAACTMIYERWERANLLSKISKTSARVLMCGILDNTLNFGATITTERDKKAYAALAAIADLPDDWPAQYFKDCERSLMADFANSLQNDTKILTLDGWDGRLGVGQMAIWNRDGLSPEHYQAMEQVVSARQSPWFVNIISIGEGKNYLYCKDNRLKAWLSKLLDTEFTEDTAQTNRLWLRKEIIKQAMEKADK